MVYILFHDNLVLDLVHHLVFETIFCSVEYQTIELRVINKS
jgi:hypothetical protein